MDGLATIFAENGGLIGLIILALFVVIIFLISTLTKIVKDLLITVRKNDERLIDFKKAAWETGKLRERRHLPRSDDDD